MKTLHLLFNHTLIDAQRKDAIASLGIDRIVSLPPHLQQIWSDIPPQESELSKLIAPILEYIRSEVKEGDICLVQGDFGATYLAVQQVWMQGALPVYATTKRRVVEQRHGDQTHKVSLFEHIRFRAYERMER